MKFAQRGGTTKLLYNGGGQGGGVIVQEPKCNTMMCEFQMKFAQWGGVQRGGALCNMHVFDASLLFFPFRAKLKIIVLV